MEKQAVQKAVLYSGLNYYKQSTRRTPTLSFILRVTLC